MEESTGNNHETGLEIAVIGMAGRFPGAGTIDEFWNNIRNGVESISFFSDEELIDAGIQPELLKNPDYVKAKGILDDIESFDSSFFNYSPREALFMDPQFRLAHECAWHTLEDAGYDPGSYPGAIGFYVGSLSNYQWVTRLLNQVTSHSEQISIGSLNDRDFLSTRVAYKLNLKGPAVNVQTACSTSLVAIHMACQGLLSGESDMALAGGVSIWLPHKTGYLYETGMVRSPDGHCRAFDARSKGTNSGDAVAFVLLKRLEDARADRDNIYAILKGSAINNDGDRKVGYTAPSVQAQAEVIRAAQQMAEVEPESITYVEAHGTGTPLGDPVEIEALKRAFNTEKRQYCGIGSLKTNVGHMDAVAGVGGFIKTVLALKHKLIPPSLHFESPNPVIDFGNSPFYVNTTAREWETGDYPLRAGVSSFGIGGTNAHAVLERFETPSAPSQDSRYRLILFSARTADALERMTRNLGNYLKEHPRTNLADAAYTLQVGRKVHQHRRMAVCRDIDSAVDILTPNDQPKYYTHVAKEEKKSVIFMFSGLGSQYVNMGLDLYKSEPVFRQEMDRCFSILVPLLGFDIKDILYPSEIVDDSDNNQVARTDYAQILIFIIEYALARLLMKWGITPDAMIGYSFGEYVAACISGVFSLEDVLRLVVYRGKLVQKLPSGIMLSVPMEADRLKPLLSGQLSLAIDNGPSCIVAGPAAAVEALESRLKNEKCLCMRVQTSHAIHSPMMGPILKEYEEEVAKVTLDKPSIPYISNVTGTWITEQQAVDPASWSAHLGQTVQFSAGIKELLKTENAVFVEIGPGRDLTTLIMRYIEDNPEQQAVNLIRNPLKDISDVEFLYNRVGRLWMWGVPVDWRQFNSEENRHRISLPLYPFERRSFWPGGSFELTGGDRQNQIDPLIHRKTDIADWFYIPSWKRVIPGLDDRRELVSPACWLMFIDDAGVGDRLKENLEKQGHCVITVKPGAEFKKEDHLRFTVNPGQGRESDYDRLFDELENLESFPNEIIHLWSIAPGTRSVNPLDFHRIDETLDLGFYSLLSLAQAIGRKHPEQNFQIKVVTDNMQEVTGGDGQYPAKSTVLGPVRIIPAEYANIRCCSIDIDLSIPSPQYLHPLLESVTSEINHPVTAIRGIQQWVPLHEPQPLAESSSHAPLLKQEGVYLITGGLGGIGLYLAQYLAETVSAKLVLTTRSQFPPRDSWDDFMHDESGDESTRNKINKVKALEEAGAEVVVINADITDAGQMQAAVGRAIEKFGGVNGVVHSAGLPDGEVIQRRTRESAEKILAPKLRGTLVLEQVLKDVPLDFIVFCSSTASILGGIGQVGYCAANNFLDAFTQYKNIRKIHTSTPVISIDWDRWQNVGIATIAEGMHKKLTGEDLPGGITGSEGMEAFGRILARPFSQVVVASRDFDALIQDAAKPVSFKGDVNYPDAGADSRNVVPRPVLETPYVAPQTGTQQKIAQIWASFFGYEKVGIQDDFFELGGDSLKAIVVISRIHQALDVEIPLTEFFAQLNIRNLSQYINSAGKSEFAGIPPVEKKDYYTLSSAQKRLFIMQQMEQDSVGYNETQVILLEGTVDKDKLEETIRQLIRRHENLRTSIRNKGEEPVQKIHEYEDIDFRVQYREIEFDGDWTVVDNMIKEFIRPFDLSRAPLFRLGLTKLKQDRYMAMFDIHHIVSDGVSTAIFVDEFMKLYSGAPLAPPRLQYKDYAEWQNSPERKELLKQQEQNWLKVFPAQPPVLNLPTDYPRPEIKSHEGDLVPFELDQQETAILKNITREADVTLYMAALAVFSLLLSKLSGQEDIVIGAPTAGRMHTDLEGIMGVFVNILAIRTFPSAEKTFKEFLQQVKEQTLAAFNNQEYQFDNLVEKVLTKRDSSRNPLFDVVFNLLNHSEFDENNATFMNNKGTAYNFEHNIARFDINLSAVDYDDRIKFNFEYCTRLFDLSTIQRFIEYFKAILSSLSEGLEQKLSDIKMITLQEQEEFLTIVPVARN